MPFQCNMQTINSALHVMSKHQNKLIHAFNVHCQNHIKQNHMTSKMSWSWQPIYPSGITQSHRTFCFAFKLVSSVFLWWSHNLSNSFSFPWPTRAGKWNSHTQQKRWNNKPSCQDLNMNMLIRGCIRTHVLVVFKAVCLRLALTDLHLYACSHSIQYVCHACLPL